MRSLLRCAYYSTKERVVNRRVKAGITIVSQPALFYNKNFYKNKLDHDCVTSRNAYIHPCLSNRIKMTLVRDARGPTLNRDLPPCLHNVSQRAEQ